MVSRKYVPELPMDYRMYHLICYAAFKANLGGWLPRKLRRWMGLPKTRTGKVLTSPTK